MASISTLTDDFSGSSVNASIWNSHDAGTPADLTVSGGNLNIVAEQDGVYRGVDTVDTYDMTGAGLVVHVADWAIGSRNPCENDVPYIQFDSSGLEAVWWNVAETTIAPAWVIGGAVTNAASSTLNATTHAWLRIRESSGTIYWDRSSDGSSWTNDFSMAKAGSWTLTAVTVGLWVGREPSAAPAYTIKIDAVNPSSSGSASPLASGAPAVSHAASPTVSASASPTAQVAAAISHAASPTIGGPSVIPTVGTAVSVAAAPTIRASGSPAATGATSTSTVATPTITATGRPAPSTVAATSTVATPTIGGTQSPAAQRAVATSTAASPTIHTTANAPASAAATTSTAAGGLTVSARASVPAVVAAAMSHAASSAQFGANQISPATAVAVSHAATPTIPTGALPNPQTAVAVSRAAAPTTTSAIPVVPVVAPVAPVTQLVAVITGREIGCARWTAVIADPLLRPLFRLNMTSGSVTLDTGGSGQATVAFRPSCQTKIVEGWHHLLLFRCDRADRPVFAGEIDTADQSGNIQAKDLIVHLERRFVEGNLLDGRTFDATTHIARILRVANGQGRVPIVPARHGNIAEVASTLDVNAGDTLAGVLDGLARLGIVYCMVGPVLRYGVGETAPAGGVLTDRMFHRFKWEVGANVLTRVIVRGAGTAQGSWPAQAKVTVPAGALIVDAQEVRTPAACQRLARIHYETKAGPSVAANGVQLRRGAPLTVHDLIPGRRFVAVDCQRRLRAMITRTEVSIGGGGTEAAVNVNLERYVPAILRRSQ